MHHLDKLFEKNAASGSTDHEVQHPERGESQSSDTGLAGRGGVISTATNRTYCHLSKSQAESATQWQIIAVEWIHEVRLPSARAAGVWSDDAVPSNANPLKIQDEPKSPPVGKMCGSCSTTAFPARAGFVG